MSAVKDHVDKFGGSIIFLFEVARLVVVLILLGLAIFSFVQEEVTPSSAVNAFNKCWNMKRKGKHRYSGGSLTKREWLDLTLCLTYVRHRCHFELAFSDLTQLYAASLALATVTARKAVASVTSFHLSSLLLGTFSVYAYRNIWPLLTFTLSPADAYEGALLWVRIGLLAFGAVLIPLLVPRRYTPIDPEARLALTKSYFSIINFGLRIPSRPSTLSRLPRFFL